MSIVVTNKAGKTIEGWDSPLELAINDGTRCVPFSFPAGEAVEIAAEYVGWTLKLEARGFSFADGTREATIEAGGRYTIRADTKTPPLTAAEQREAHLLCMATLEHSGWFPPWVDADPDMFEQYCDEPWLWISEAIGRSSDSYATVKEMVCHASASTDDADWKAYYRSYAARQTPTSMSAEARRERTAGAFNIVAYFRALDRYPGDNADMHVLKYVFGNDPTTAKVVANHCCNWDGQHYCNDYPIALESQPLDQLGALVLDPLRTLLSETSEPNIELVDSFDGDEDDYDYEDSGEGFESQWSSIELLVYGPIPADQTPDTGRLGYPKGAVEHGPLLLRVHLHTTQTEKPVDHPQGRALLEGLREWLGMDNVQSFSAGDSVAADRIDAGKAGGNWDEVAQWPYLMPHYLHDCS